MSGINLDQILKELEQAEQRKNPETVLTKQERETSRSVMKFIKEKEVNDLYNTYITEAEGTSGTMKLGKGPVYKEKREKHDALLNDLQQLKGNNATKISEKEALVSQLREKQDQQISSSQPIIDGFDGLMARINALGELAWFPSFFIFLLFGLNPCFDS